MVLFFDRPPRLNSASPLFTFNSLCTLGFSTQEPARCFFLESERQASPCTRWPWPEHKPYLWQQDPPTYWSSYVTIWCTYGTYLSIFHILSHQYTFDKLPKTSQPINIHCKPTSHTSTAQSIATLRKFALWNSTDTKFYNEEQTLRLGRHSPSKPLIRSFRDKINVPEFLRPRETKTKSWKYFIFSTDVYRKHLLQFSRTLTANVKTQLFMILARLVSVTRIVDFQVFLANFRPSGT